MCNARPAVSKARVLVSVLVLVLAGSLTWGMAGARAASPSPSAAAGQVVLRLGWTQEPDNLSVFIGYQNTSYEIWALNSYLFGSGDHNQPTLDLASRVPHPGQRRHLGRRQDLDDPHPERRQVPGRGAADRRRRRLHLQLHHQEPHDEPDQLHGGHQDGDGARPHHGADRLLRAQGPDMETTLVPILPEHIWAHVSPAAASDELRVKPPLVGSGPFETVSHQGQLRRDGQEPLLVRQEAEPSTRSTSSSTRTPTRWSPT